MAAPADSLSKDLADLQALVWSYEEGLKSRIIYLHRKAYAGKEKPKSDADMLQEELCTCQQSKAHGKISKCFANMVNGLARLGETGRQAGGDEESAMFGELKVLCDRLADGIADSITSDEAVGEKDQQTRETALATGEDDQQSEEGEELDMAEVLDITRHCAWALMDRVEELEEDVKIKEIEVEALKLAGDYLSRVINDDKASLCEEISDKIADSLLQTDQDFSLSRLLARQNEGLRSKVAAAERTVASLSQKLSELNTPPPCDGRQHQSQTQAAENDDEEQEDIFEDCVSEWGEVRADDSMVADTEAESSYVWPDFPTPNASEASGAVSKAVWEDLSGLDLLVGSDDL